MKPVVVHETTDEEKREEQDQNFQLDMMNGNRCAVYLSEPAAYY
jgi:hypothetical protein